MNFKIDTKEKFTVITPETAIFNANIAEELKSMVESKVPGNIVLNFKNVGQTQQQAVEELVALQQACYHQKKSFVICEVQPAVQSQWHSWELDEQLNQTPTESEAGDIVQMEEIERELSEGEENDF